MTATRLRASLPCAGSAAAQNESAPVFTCNPKAIAAEDRPRYHQLVKQIRLAIRERIEIADGYTFKLDSKAITLPATAEWMGMERLCCPFLTLQLSASANQPHWILSLTGPEGIKQLVDSEFPAR